MSEGKNVALFVLRTSESNGGIGRLERHSGGDPAKRRSARFSVFRPQYETLNCMLHKGDSVKNSFETDSFNLKISD